MNLEFIKNAIEIKFNEKQINYDDILSINTTLVKPTVKYVSSNTKYYTIIMIDPDAPNYENPIYKYYLHWLIINNDKTIVDYAAPSPPKDSGNHRYYTCVFEQKNKIDIKFNFERPNFNLEKFVEDNNLQIIGCFKFNVVG